MDRYDVVIRNATIVDGSGGAPVVGDVAIAGDRVAAVGGTVAGSGREEIEAGGLVAAPGFINMLSWANVSLLVDGRSQSDIRQGVTLEVLGEGTSMGPLTEAMRRQMVARQGDLRYDVTWTTLGEYLEHLVRRGVAPNVASFVGATTARIYVLGYERRAPSAAELDRMRAVVREAMRDGAMGVSTALIYAPASYAATDEVVALAEVAAEHGGLYISHIRNEEAGILEALEEFFTIVRTSGARGEIYHLKVSGERHWPLMDRVLGAIEEARAAGLPVTADMYPYTASATGLDTAVPGWAHEGGPEALVARLREPATRAQIREQLALFTTPERVLLVAVKADHLKPLIGRTLAEVAAARGQDSRDTLLDLLVEDESRVGAVFFTMSEANVRQVMARPWVAFGSDAASLAPEGVFLRSGTHPRAYGTFARVLGRYVREERVLTLPEAVRRMTALPAETLRLRDRGRLVPGAFADVVVFDPDRIIDHATYDQPHRYATGVVHVFVNGVAVLRDGEHTGALPGRVVRGPGSTR